MASFRLLRCLNFWQWEVLRFRRVSRLAFAEAPYSERMGQGKIAKLQFSAERSRFNGATMIAVGRQRESMRHLVLGSMLLCIGASALADDDPPTFDRPGIAFPTSTLPSGGLAWEQGLPDGSWDKADGVRTTTWVADTLLRYGLSETVEVQLGVDSFGGERVHGDGAGRSQNSGGDGWVSLKWVPASNIEAFSWGVLATASLPFGKAPLGDGGNNYDIGVAAAWDLSRDGSVSLYLDGAWGDDGSGWLFSPSYSFALSSDVGAFVEAGFGTGAQEQRVAGGGMTWMATRRLQLDAWFLRGLDDNSPDLQAGVGLSIYFD